MSITTEQLKRLKALADAATPGPWISDIRPGCVAVYPGKPENCLSEARAWAVHYKGGHWDADGGWTVDSETVANNQFIAAARQAVPDLCAEVEALREALRRLLRSGGNVGCDSTRTGKPVFYCRHCGGEWLLTRVERHETGCPLVAARALLEVSK